MERRLSLLLSSPRVAPGLLSAAGWDALRGAGAVLAADPDAPQAGAIAAAGILVERPPSSGVVGAPSTPGGLAAYLLDRVEQDGTVVWVGSRDGDPGLSEALAVALPEEDPPELELLVGSWDTPGSRLLDAVAVMDRLRGPGGCPWDAEQTHASLTPYLIEEAHEAVEALETGDREHMAEELGDVLLQVLFHARVAAEHQDDPFDIDDVAATLVAKLVRRHPHVFADVSADDAATVEANWEQIKAAEKAAKVGGSNGPLDGLPAGMPELARARKVITRLKRAGELDRVHALTQDAQVATDPTARVGAQLIELVLAANELDVDPAAALRDRLRELVRACATGGPGDS